jgi:CheY-like chemotaxis protein
MLTRQIRLISLRIGILPVEVALIDDSIDSLLVAKKAVQRVLPHAVIKTWPRGDLFVRAIVANDRLPDVVICDYLMPRMSGLEVHDTLCRLGYQGKFIIMTAAKGDMEREFSPMLLKPYRIDQIREVLQ